MFGDGSSLAMTGAFTLVDALTVDIPSGLRDYEARHRPQRVAKENAVTPAANLFVPLRPGCGHRRAQRRRPRNAIGRQGPRNCIVDGAFRVDP
jgi:hypothetical protein